MSLYSAELTSKAFFDARTMFGYDTSVYIGHVSMKFIFITLCFSWFLLGSVPAAQAAITSSIIDDSEIVNPTVSDAPDIYIKARVTAITEEGVQKNEDGSTQPYQKVTLELVDGVDKGKKIQINHGGVFAIDAYQKVSVGDVVIVNKPANAARDDIYYIADHYRNSRVALVVSLFFILAIIFGGWKGLTAILGMLFSAGVVFYGIAPRVLAGANALIVALLGGAVIIVVSLYVSHGFSKRTSIAVGASLATLVLAALCNYAAVIFTHLTGGGTEEAYYLQMDGSSIDARGLLLGGIIIGVLGVLDDITTAQAAAVEEISLANTTLSFRELYRRGISVGKEHIASLVNTLVLAYVGASFPIVLLYILHKNIPVWLLLNSNFIAEEIVRTVVGSTALVLAVPLTTIMSAYIFSPKSVPAIAAPLTREERLEKFWKDKTKDKT